METRAGEVSDDLWFEGSGFWDQGAGFRIYKGTSLIRTRNPLGHDRRPVHRALGGSWRDGRCLMSKVPL